jgi:hypothetical protein
MYVLLAAFFVWIIVMTVTDSAPAGTEAKPAPTTDEGDMATCGTCAESVR